jgi:hypothetical protein
MKTFGYFLGTETYSNSGFKLSSAIVTLCVFSSDGMVACSCISNVLVQILFV